MPDLRAPSEADSAAVSVPSAVPGSLARRLRFFFTRSRAPRSAPRALTVYRGVGLLAGLAAALSVGLADGVFVIVATPSGVLSVRSALLVALHCALVIGASGLFVGVAQEFLLAAARRRPRLVALGHWVLDGPRRWFARDVDAALSVWLAALYVTLLAGPILPVSFAIITRFHSQMLAATAIFLAVVLGLFGAGVLTMIVAWPLGWLLARVGRCASPAVALLACLLALVLQTVRFLRLYVDTFRAIDPAPPVAAFGALVASAVAAGLLASRARRVGRSFGLRVVLGASLLALAGFVFSALTFGSRRTVASTVFQSSRITGPVVRVFQRVIDLDGDHYGALFAGGDCNDRNARIHPGARDLPGNGIDENCSGADARREDEAGDGHMVAVRGSLADAQPSFVLLSVDAVRPEHVGAYGYRRNTTPNIDRFARGAAVFTNAYCTSPRSLRSFSSIWTGRYPSMIRWGQDNQYLRLLPDNVVLAEELGRAGYHSSGFSNADYFHRTQGFFRGFTEWHEPTFEWKGDVNLEVTQVLTYLEARANDSQPFFLWAHMMEPHDPYRAWPEHPFGNSEVDHYDAEIARADEAVGRILRAVDQQAARRPIVVAVFSDHGEAFGEHGYFNHSSDLHQEQVRVMLMVRAPDVAPGLRSALVSLMDLEPTILNYAHRPAVEPIDARSLVPVLQDPTTPYVGGRWRDHLFMEVSPDGLIPQEQKGLLQPPFKLIYDVSRGLWQMYDLARDPAERRNLFDDGTAVGSQLRERLMSWVDSTSVPGSHIEDVLAAARLRSPPAHYDVPLNVRFGDVFELLGVDILTPHVRRGETLRLVLYLRVLRATQEPYWLHVRFEPTDGGSSGLLFQAPHYPVHGRYSTTRWMAGEILRDEVPLHVEPEIRPTRYEVRMRVQVNEWGPVLTPDSHTVGPDVVSMGELEVEP